MVNSSLICRSLLVLVAISALITVVQGRPEPNLRILHEILEERRAEIEQELEIVDEVIGSQNLLAKLRRNRRRSADMSMADLKSVKRTRCYFNPISC